MDFHLYAGQSAWLLVPDCMVASQAATVRHGPLQPLFQISDKHLDAQELARVMADVEDHMFAEISHDMALRIVHRGGDAIRSADEPART